MNREQLAPVLRAAATIAEDGEILVIGSLFVAETTGHVVRRISQAGDITTVIGTGVAGSSTGYGEGGPAVDAQLGEPLGLGFDRVGYLLVADATIQRVRRATVPP